MSKIKNGGLDQYGARPFEQQQFGTAGVEWVKFSKNLQERSPLKCLSAVSTGQPSNCSELL